MSDRDAAAQLACEVFYGNDWQWGMLNEAFREKWREVADVTQYGTPAPDKLDAATIERCARIARLHGATLDLAHGHEDAEGQEDRWYEGGKSAACAIADEIAALATDPHQHGGKGA